MGIIHVEWVTKLNRLSEKPSLHWFCKKFCEILWVERCVIFSIEDLQTWTSPPLPPVNLVITFHEGTEADVHEINADPRLEAGGDAGHNLEMIRAGHRLFLARHSGEIVFYVWAVTKRKSAHNTFFVLKDNEFVVARAFTRKDIRGLGLYPRGLAFMFQTMQGAGYSRALVDIASHNQPSINAAAKVGFKALAADFFRVRVFFRDYLVSTGCLKDRFVKKKRRSERI